MWFIYTLATTLLWGLAELFYKKGARPTEKYAHLKTCVCVGGVMGLHALFMLATQDISYDPVNIVRYLPVSLLYIVSMGCSYFGMRFIEESISDPIENTSGALCTVLCVLILGEEISRGSLLAIGVIVIGILGIGFLEHYGKTDRKRKIGRKLALLAFAMPFFYAILDAVGSFLDIYYLDIATSPLAGITEDNIEAVANTSYELTFALCAVGIYGFLHTKKVHFNLPAQGDKLLAAVCETAGQFTYVYAMSGNGAIAAPVISSVCMVSLILSRIFLKEKLTWLQYLFIAMIIGGIVILAYIEG